MRIDDLNRASVTTGTEQSGSVGPEPNPGKESPRKDAIAGSDQADVSQLAQSLSGSGSGRVEQLRLEVQSGSYNVSAAAVANSIIEAHLREGNSKD
jgi:anti-sigma28 factor (negative regulator of flagellin synthesis)